MRADGSCESDELSIRSFFHCDITYGVRMQINVNGIDTRYVLSNEGGGPWLTFIHQLGGDLSIWDQLAGYFRDDYTVLRYDGRGHGKTAASGAPFSIADLSHDLVTLLDALDAPSTHLV